MVWIKNWSQFVDFCLASFGIPKSIAIEDESRFSGLVSTIKQHNRSPIIIDTNDDSCHS